MISADTLRALIEQRERLLALLGDPIIPAFWRGRALDIFARVADEPSDEAIVEARTLVESTTVSRRLWALRGRVELLVEHARRGDDPGALAGLCADSPAEGIDLLVALEAIDLADCSPRMLLRRRVLTSHLRLDADDAEARAQGRDLLANGRLRRRVFEVMSDAVERDDVVGAQAARAVLIGADEETMGWQEDALRLVEGPGAGRR